MESYRVGSIAWSARYFADGKFTSRAFQMAEIAAKAVLDEAPNAYRRDSWDVAYGSAGTIGAVEMCWQLPAGRRARYPGGAGLVAGKLLEAQNADRLRLAGMKDDRRAIIGGGLSILRATFDLLGINENEGRQWRAAARRVV